VQKLPVADLVAPESGLARVVGNLPAAAIRKRNPVGVEIRGFRRPRAHSGDRSHKGLAHRLLAGRQLRLDLGHGDFRSIRPGEFHRQCRLCLHCAAVDEMGFQFEHSGLIIVGQTCPEVEIAQVQCVRRPQVNVAENPRQPEHVLILQIGSIAELIHLCGQDVLSLIQIARDVELSRSPRILRIADLLPVDPQVKRRIHPAEDNEGAASLPSCRNLEPVPVGPHLIAVFLRKIRKMLRRHTHHLRRVLRERINDVGVQWPTIAFDLPVRWHRDFLPTRVVEFHRLEPHRPRRRIAHMMEFPVPVERLAPRRFQTPFGHSLICRWKRHRRRPRRFLVDAEYRLVFPIRRLRHSREDGKRGNHCNQRSFHGGFLEDFEFARAFRLSRGQCAPLTRGVKQNLGDPAGTGIVSVS
jgi:hypothetical protein